MRGGKLSYAAAKSSVSWSLKHSTVPGAIAAFGVWPKGYGALEQPDYTSAGFVVKLQRISGEKLLSSKQFLKGLSQLVSSFTPFGPVDKNLFAFERKPRRGSLLERKFSWVILHAFLALNTTSHFKNTLDEISRLRLP
jgi:hypothetical protein